MIQAAGETGEATAEQLQAQGMALLAAGKDKAKEDRKEKTTKAREEIQKKAAEEKSKKAAEQAAEKAAQENTEQALAFPKAAQEKAAVEEEISVCGHVCKRGIHMGSSCGRELGHRGNCTY